MPFVDTTFEILWLRWLLADLETSQSSHVDLYCDNRSAIQIAHDDVFHERTKHIEIDCHFIRQHLLRHELRKPHSPSRFRVLVSKLKLVTTPPT